MALDHCRVTEILCLTWLMVTWVCIYVKKKKSQTLSCILRVVHFAMLIKPQFSFLKNKIKRRFERRLPLVVQESFWWVKKTFRLYFLY